MNTGHRHRLDDQIKSFPGIDLAEETQHQLLGTSVKRGVSDDGRSAGKFSTTLIRCGSIPQAKCRCLRKKLGDRK